ncbi:MAG: FAD-dependent oxidoreductase [Alphaproteobacteria bacterium]|nr:FAD-dependent oxidoreductase [Alphaproteobacteria bacterium]
MGNSLPARAGVVIIGGGVAGCSVAYHLAKAGHGDVVLLERKKLTCGATWHAAGLIGQLRATHNMTRLAQYTAELYAGLEAETGQATGFRRTGSVSIAADNERFEELKRGASMARCFGLPVEIIGPAEIKARWPLLETNDLVGGIFLPSDGKANPVDVTMALAKGARRRGARVLEDTKVTGIRVEGGRVRGVATDRGEIETDIVVNCAGMWARDVGRMAGTNVPLQACEHFYIVTEPMPGLTPDTPVLRDPGACAYYKEDAGKLLLGCFEPVAKPWGLDGIPEDFSFDSLPEDFDHFAPILEQAMKRVPALRDAGIQLFFNGPESFTPDDRYLLGAAPEVRGMFVAAGFNSIGIQSGGGAGKVLADWIIHDRLPMDLWDVDIRRMMPFQRNRLYLKDRVTEGLGLLYAMHWPFRQFESARPARLSPLHERLKARGACFGEAAGWERANWYAPPGVVPKYEYTYGRQNWFVHSAAEHRAAREDAGLIDLSSFGKFLVQGADAAKTLNRICANDIDVAPGRVVYTQWLNEQGGIEADLTVFRLGETEFLVISSGSTQTRDRAWLRRHIPADARCTVTDQTSAHAVIGLMGPNARALLARLTPGDVSAAALPFGATAEIELGYALARAARVSYAGELGFELYIPTEFAVPVYDAITAASDVRHVGHHALNSLRIEKAFRAMNQDIGIDETPIEAGLAFAVAWDKPGGFIGREALLKRRAEGPRKRIVQFALKDTGPMLYHNEPIWRNGRLVGATTSAMYGHTLGRAVALGVVAGPDGGTATADYVLGGRYEIEIAGERFAADVSLKPMYDPDGIRMRG